MNALLENIKTKLGVKYANYARKEHLQLIIDKNNATLVLLANIKTKKENKHANYVKKVFIMTILGKKNVKNVKTDIIKI